MAKWLVDNCRKSQEEMVKMEDDKSIKDFPISPLPKKTAIVIDKNTRNAHQICQDVLRYNADEGVWQREWILWIANQL